MTARLSLLVATVALCAAGLARSEPPNLQGLKDRIVAYHDSGQWDRDTAVVVRHAEHALDAGLRRKLPGKPAIVFDVDETALSNWEIEQKLGFGYEPNLWTAWEGISKAAPNVPVRELYRYAREHQVAVFFVTGRKESGRAGTEKNLTGAGYTDFVRLVMRPNDYTGPVVPYKSGARQAITREGYRILVNIGDQQSDLDGGYAESTFKVPNPMYIVK